MADLLELGRKLLEQGPHKIEATPRRVRGLLGGTYIFDSCRAKYVWEHQYYPYFYIPTEEFLPDTLSRVSDTDSSDAVWLAHLTNLTNPSKTTTRVIGFTDSSSPLNDLVRIEVSALDKWFVEDTAILGPHPKDPYKRIETFPTSREVRIEVNGKVVAKSGQNVFLYETMLRPRYYLSEGCVDWSVLRRSETTSYCPYKGMANYYHLVVGDKEIKDAVWYYDYPTSESALVAGRLCFYNEKVDVFIEGVKEK